MQYRQQQAQIMRRRMAQMQCGSMGSSTTSSTPAVPSSSTPAAIHASASKPSLAVPATQPSQPAPHGALVAVKQVQQAAQMQVNKVCIIIVTTPLHKFITFYIFRCYFIVINVKQFVGVK